MALASIIRSAAAVGLVAAVSGTAAKAADLLSGEWVGSYICYQGPTALTLTVEPDGGQWSGVFAFGPNKDNKALPHGSYMLVITETGGSFHMEPGAWIERPEGYTAVVLDGAISDDLSQLSGDLDFEGCTTFETVRTTPLPAPSPSKTK